MTTASILTGQDIGRAHHATRTVLERRLAVVGLDFPSWVTVNALGAGGGSVEPDDLVDQVVRGLKLPADQVRSIVAQLAGLGLLRRTDDRIELTAPGTALHAEVTASIREITGRLYGGIASDDLTVAHRVLATVTARADAELAGAVPQG